MEVHIFYLRSTTSQASESNTLTCFFVFIIKKLYIIELARGYSPKGEIENKFSNGLYLCGVDHAANKSNHKEFDDSIEDTFIQIVDKFFTWFL